MLAVYVQCQYTLAYGSATSCRASRSNGTRKRQTPIFKPGRSPGFRPVRPPEPREAAVGYTEGEQLLFVVHVIRHEEIIRLISAREATRDERRQYEDT
ncbi:MAG: BrnT family toxin [Proteobacteria bacterium]|nr:BrnT family toxin [Pseudomonadota bacterium]